MPLPSMLMHFAPGAIPFNHFVGALPPPPAMPNDQLLMILGIFFFLAGACVGSFLNVVIWRLPYRGREVSYLGQKGAMNLSWPPSHCPMCDAPIRMYQNIPVLSYVFLRGKCAKCRAAIPIRYPLVEMATSMLWGGLFLAYFVARMQAYRYPWQPPGSLIMDLRSDWPPYVVHGLFASALLAASAIDVDLFIIPLAIPWFLAILGVVASTLIGKPLTKNFAILPGLSDATWWMAKPILGATAGVILANVLVWLRLLPRSFPWEVEGNEAREAVKKDDVSAAEPGAERAKDEPLAPPPKLTRFGPAVAGVLACIVLVIILWVTVSAPIAATAGVAAAVVIFLVGVLPRDEGQLDVTGDVEEEITVGNVRMEISKEILFLAVPVACAGIAHAIPGELPQHAWLMRMLGSLLGILVGGGLIWLMRIGGTIAFNKQAVGLGDIHLMAGVGAVLGAPLVIMAFFISPFPALLWILILKLSGKPSVLQFGPWLAVGSILALLIGNPILCQILHCT